MRTLTAPLALAGGGPTLPAGTCVYLPIWWVHRAERNWGLDAATFRPERHLDAGNKAGGVAGAAEGAGGGGGGGGGEGGKSASSFRSIAFSGGQRNCPGQRFAMVEATVLLATLLRAAKFELADPGFEVESVSTGVVQKPKGGEIWMRVSARTLED